MQWDEQSENLLNGWFTTPQKAWENWWDALAGSTRNGHGGSATPPPLNLWNSVMEQWLSTMQQSMALYSPTLPESARKGVEQLLQGQQHTQHLMQLSTDAWQSIMTSASSPAEWQQALNRYMAQLRQQLTSTDEAAKLMKNGTELWQLYASEMQKFSQPWMAIWSQLPQQLGMMAAHRAGNDMAASNPVTAIANLYWDAYHQTLGRMVNMPSLGLMRELNEKINRGFTIWQENQRINLDYQALLGNAMLDAFEAYMQKLLEMAKAGKAVESQKELLELWVEVADETFLQLFHSERYATTQSQYVNSSMALRRQQREITEIILRMNDLPTQSALDEAHHNIFLLRKEVKALQKSVHELSSELAAHKETTPQSASTTATKTATAAKSTATTRSRATTAKNGSAKTKKGA